jgi:hypothetical protein
MLGWLQARLLTGQRRLRLFLCACCRLAWPELHPSLQQLIEAAEDEVERWPPGRRGWPSCSRTHDVLLALHGEHLSELEEEVRLLALQVLFGAGKLGDCVTAVRSLCPPATPARQSDLLRELFGDPFRKVRHVGTLLHGQITGWPEAKRPDDILFVREWLLWHDGLVGRFASTIHEERAFDRLPILDDALEEAGCAEPALLEHCRGPGDHVRGCWVLDLLTGRS